MYIFNKFFTQSNDFTLLGYEKSVKTGKSLIIAAAASGVRFAVVKIIQVYTFEGIVKNVRIYRRFLSIRLLIFKEISDIML